MQVTGKTIEGRVSIVLLAYERDLIKGVEKFHGLS